MMRAIRVKLRFVVEPDDDGFHVYCPELKGLHAGGATEEEAIKNGQDAAEAYLHSLLKHDDPIPLGIVEARAC